MILATNPPEPGHRRERRDTPIFEGFRTDYIVPPEQARPSPQAFLVEQDPNYHLRSHYHLQHQFQVVVAGSGTLGQHAVAPFSVHYSSPESGYGPIISGAEGLSYFTLRAVSDSGAWMLPEDRARMRRGLRKRQFTAQPENPGSPFALLERSEAVLESLFAEQPDGLAAWFLRLPPMQMKELPDSRSGAGRFYVVTGGGLIIDDARYEPLGVAFVSADERVRPIRATDAGLEMLVLQFPSDAVDAGSGGI